MNLLILSSIKPILIYFGIVVGVALLIFLGAMLIEAFPSLIGGFVGYYFLPVIYLSGFNITLWICMAIGGCLGVLNYEIVSVRILKLQTKN